MMNNRGFSLAEVLIALVLMSMMVTSVISMTNSAGETKDRILTEDEAKLSVEMAMARMAKDINLYFNHNYFSRPLNVGLASQGVNSEEAVEWMQQKAEDTTERFPAYTYNYLPVPALLFEEDSLEFMSIGQKRRYQNEKSSRFNWIRYAVENDKNSSYKILKRYIYSKAPFSKEDFNFDNIKGQILLENLEEFSFLFWDSNKEKFVEEYSTNNPGQSPLKGIKVDFKWKDKDKREFFYTQVFRPLWPSYEVETEEQIRQIQSSLQPITKK